MARLRPAIEQANMSTVCDKRELNVDMTGPRLNYGTVAHLLLKDTVQTLGRKLAAPLRPAAPSRCHAERTARLQ